MPEWIRWIGLSLAVVLLDQASKFQIVATMTGRDDIEVASFFKLVLFYNEGAAFSFLSQAGGWQRTLFMGIAAGASLLMIHLIRKHRGELLFSFALSFILGGALGNLADRIRIGHVVDFLYFHLGEHYFPAFNLADSAITLGAALMILDSIRKERK